MPWISNGNYYRLPLSINSNQAADAVSIDASPQDDLFLKLLRRFQEEGVEYVLIGGQAVRLNGFVRATEDVDVLLKTGQTNGEKIIRALIFYLLRLTWIPPGLTSLSMAKWKIFGLLMVYLSIYYLQRMGTLLKVWQAASFR